MFRLHVFAPISLEKKNVDLIKAFSNYANIIFDNEPNEETDIIITDENDVNNYSYLNVPVIKLTTDYETNNELMDNELFIETQVKFRYGKWYNIIKKKQFFYESEILSRVNVTFDNSGGKFITNDNGMRFYEHIQKRHLVFCSCLDLLNVDKKKVFPVNLEDHQIENTFSVCHNRMISTDSIILYPLESHHMPPFLTKKTIIPFKEKQNKAVWRGDLRPWNFNNDKKIKNQRYTFLENTFQIHDDIDVGLSNWDEKKLEDFIVYKKYLKEPISREIQMNNKFIINLEGNDWSSSFIWALTSNCCPLHVYPFTFEHILFGDGLKEWVHFVPIASDGSDLIEKYEWCLANLEKCEAIANNGMSYMKKYNDINIYTRIQKRFFDIWPLTRE